MAEETNVVPSPEDPQDQKEMSARERFKQHHLTAVAQAQPKSSCKVCWGRGYAGINTKDQTLVVCSCYRKSYKKIMTEFGYSKAEYPMSIPLKDLEQKNEFGGQADKLPE